MKSNHAQQQRQQIVKETLTNFPKSKIKTLAEMLFNKYPELFLTLETARTNLRYYSGKRGERDRQRAEVHGLLRELGKSEDPFKLPESEAPDFTRVELKPEENKVLILSDIHFRFQDNDALRLALNYGLDKGANTIILNGDILDMFQASNFDHDPRLFPIADELEAVRGFLRNIYEAFGHPKIYFKVGNHEERLERYLYVKAPALLGVADFKLDTLLRLSDVGATYVDKKRIIMAGNLAILHGHEFGKSIFSPVNPARGVYIRAKESVIVGHHHQTSEHTEPSLHGNIVTTWSTGCLCGLTPDYQPINKWNHGFAYVEWEGESFHVQNVRIHNGVIL